MGKKMLAPDNATRKKSATNTLGHDEIFPTDVSKQNVTFSPGVAKVISKTCTAKRGKNWSKATAEVNPAALNDNHISPLAPGAVAVPGTHFPSFLGSRPNHNSLDNLFQEVVDESVADRDPSLVVDVQVVTPRHDEEHALVAGRNPAATRRNPSALTPNPTSDHETEISILNILRDQYCLTIDENRSSGTPQSLALEWLLSTSSTSLMEKGYLSDTAVFERYGLAVFFYSTNGPSWNKQTNFLTESSVCNWNKPYGPFDSPYGVDCDNDAQVRGILLPQSNLSGTIPSELRLLSNLQQLHLMGNTLGNVIPTELGRLTNMRALWINSNLLIGTLPTELGNFGLLEILSVWDNKLTGTLPTELHGCAKLQRLLLSSNNMTGPLPTELGMMSTLRSIDASDNSFAGTLATELSHLIKLEQLFVSSNELMGTLPTEIGLMTSLLSIDAYNNSFTGTLPTELGQLTNLKSVTVSQNFLNGTIPEEIANNSWLQLYFEPQKVLEKCLEKWEQGITNGTP